jgi:hypothetical protein
VLSLAAARRRAPRPLKIAPASEPELPLAIEFVGISTEQQLKALSGWPGAKRFSLTQP